MEKLLDEIKAFIGRRPAIALASAAALIAAVVVLILLNRGPEYQTLYTQLSDEDAGSVIERLREKRVPYKVDGGTISVPADSVYETRMELAGEGLPQGGGVGFEIFDKTSFGVTDFVQKVNYKRALQGELARTVAQIKEIESARVHLALPEKGVFLDDQKKARASVIVKLKPGKELGRGQVSSIVHLVANSTDNLRPEDVAVVDTAGRMWTREPGDEALMLSGSQLEYKRSIERDLEQRLQSMLEKAVGVDKVVARVAAEIDTRHIETTEERFDPDSQVVRSEHRNKEKSIGATVPVGIPGVLSNLPETALDAAQAAAAAPAQTHRQDELINYEISKVTSRVVEPIGSLERLAVSVLVDGTYQAVKDPEGNETSVYSPRTDEELSKFTEMVKAAVGYEESRGDTVIVVSTPFDQSGELAAAAALGAAGEANEFIPAHLVPVLMKYATAVLITFFILLFAVRPLIKRLTSEAAALADIQKKLPQALMAGGGGTDLSESAVNSDRDSVDRLKKTVKENPQQVAMVLKNWIKEK